MIIEEQIKALIGEQKYLDCVDLLIENTGKEKTIDPANTKDMEIKFSLLFDHLRKEGEYHLLRISAHKLKQHLKKLEQVGGNHYHKGLGYHNLGIALHKIALGSFLTAFIEDAIKEKEPLPLKPARQHLEGLFKASSEDLEKLGKYAIEISKNGPIPSNTILKKFNEDPGPPFVELWRVEYHISQIEKEIRIVINKNLPEGWMDNTEYFNWKEDIESKKRNEKAYLGKAASDSLIDYLDFSDYYKIAQYKKNGEIFWPIFGDLNEFENKMKSLKFIRNKIAHFRKIFVEDIIKVDEIRKWLKNGLEKGLGVKKEQIPSQYWDSSAHAISGNIYNDGRN
jgi:hypothetical protein